MVLSSRIGVLKVINNTKFLRKSISVSQFRDKQATDPIQKLFLEKIREYREKSKGGKLVDATPEVEKELHTELEKLQKQYGAKAGEDMTKFPSFNFPEPKLDPIDEQAEKRKGKKK